MAILLSDAILNKWLEHFYGTFLNIHQSGVHTALFGRYIAGATFAAVSVHVLCTPYNRAPVYSVNFILLG